MTDPQTRDNADYFAQFAAEMPPSHALWRAAEARVLARVALAPPVLDLGCGDGHFASLFFKEPLAVGLDRSPKQVRQAAKRGIYGRTVVAEATALPFAAGTFSTVFSNCVLEHIPSIEVVLGEVERVLRPGGTFVFTVTSNHFEEYLFGVAWLDCHRLRWCSRSLASGINRLFSHRHNDGVELWRHRLERASLTMHHTDEIVPQGAEAAWSLLLPISALETATARLNAGLVETWRRVSAPVWQRLVGSRLSEESATGGGLVVAARKDRDCPR